MEKLHTYIYIETTIQVMYSMLSEAEQYRSTSKANKEKKAKKKT